jgi:hypothetical protein
VTFAGVRSAAKTAVKVKQYADLGLRFARFGNLIETFETTTLEDAPLQFSDWFWERTRWMKGWMHTLAVCLRAAPALLLAPAYLLLLSVAAWRALWEWTRQPFVWTKTTHAPRPQPAQASTEARNFPASAAAIKARLLSTP